MKSCGDNRVNNHLQREHSELGTRSCRATKVIHQQELSLGRTPMAQGQLDRISADAKPVPVTHLPGILERERPGGSQAGKPESSTSHSQGKKKKEKNKATAVSVELCQFRCILVMKFCFACKVPSHHSPCHKNKLPPHATSPGKQKNGCKPCPSPHHDGLCICSLAASRSMWSSGFGVCFLVFVSFFFCFHFFRN